MRLAEIGETIKELRPLVEACQEEKSRIQLTLAEQRLELQHLAANLREKYDVELEALAANAPENPPSQAELIGGQSTICAAAWSAWAKSIWRPSASTKN